MLKAAIVRSTSILFILGLLGAGCARPQCLAPARTAEARPQNSTATARAAHALTAPEPSEALAPAPAPASPARAAAPTASAEPAPSAHAAATPSPKPLQPEVVVEKPYFPYQHPRPAGSVNASVADVELARWNVGGTSAPSYISNQPGFHPATRVRVDTRVIGGRLPRRRSGRRHRRLTRADVLAESRSHGYWAFRVCFERDERDHPHLHGQTLLTLWVGRSGRVWRARLRHTELRDRNVAHCLRKRARHLKFSPAPRHSFRVRLSVKLWPGDAPLPRHDLASNVEPDALDLRAVAHDVAPLKSAVTQCYEAGLGRDPALWGRVELRVDLDRKGRVRRAEQVESRFPDHQVVGCIENALSLARFPAPAQGPASFIYAVRLGRAEIGASRVKIPEPSAVREGGTP